MITIRTLINDSVKKLGELSMTPLLDIQVLLCKLLDVDRIYLITNGDKVLDKNIIDKFDIMLNKRLDGMPVQYIVKHQEFMGLDFFVEEGVLIPRPDTEILIEEIVNMYKGKKCLRVLDLGTGSGAITVSMAKFLDGAKVYSMDISEKALEIAKINAESNGVSSSIEFVNMDMLQFLREPFLNKEIDILISNPPYIPSEVIDGLQIEVKKYEPRIALDGGKDGYDFYRAIINDAHKVLVDDGILAFEVGHDQAKEIKELMICANYKEVRIVKDLAQIERVVIGRLNLKR